MNWLSIAFIIGGTQGIFLGIALFNYSKRHPGHPFLMALIWSLTISLLLRLTYSESDYIYLRYPHLTIVGDFALFLIGPALYYYTQFMIDKTYKLSRSIWLHLLPFFLFVLSFGYLLFLSKEELLLLHSNGKIYPYYTTIFSCAIIQITSYSLFLIRQIDGVKQINKEPVAYLKIIIYALLTTALCWIPGHLFSCLPSFNPFLSNLFYQISFLLMSISIFIIGLYAIRMPEIFRARPDQTEKYQHSYLDEHKAQAIKSQLLQLLATQMPYLDANLSLPVLAKMLNTNQVYLSQVINEQLGKSFHEFINEYRIQHFIEKAQHPNYSHLTLQAIALESGFKTKASFYKAFKKKMLQTPAQYLKSHSK